VIHLHYPGLPPSVNDAYTTVLTKVRGKLRPKRVLTKEGKKFKKEFAGHIAQTYPTELTIFEKNTPFAVVGQFGFPDLINKTWPEKAESRYKKRDADNRLKLLLDALPSGIDDSQFMVVTASKIQGPEETHLWVWNMEEEAPYEFLAREGKPH
jgi:Holliday junction resolvase RusA-like endonuclease